MSECLHALETHCFCQDQQHMVLHIRQNRVFPISLLEREILAVPDGFPSGNLRVHLSERYSDAEISRAVDRLKKRGLLLSHPAHPEKLDTLVFPAITHLQLSVAQDCNLRCRYCIVEQGSFGGPPQLMSRQVARQATDLLLRESCEEAQCTLSFSGGEPFLNWDVVRDAIVYSRERAAKLGRQVRYIVKTNGTLLDIESVAFIKEERIQVHLSIDGPPAVHDRMRPAISGKGSHDSVLAGLSRLLPGCAEQVLIRPTLTRFSPPLPELLDYLIGLGAGRVGLARVIAGDEDYALDFAAREQLKAEYTGMVRCYLAGAPTDAADHLVTPFLTQLGSGRQRRVDSAGGESFVVSASGGIYPHPDLAEQDEYRLGHVETGLDPDKLAWWRAYLDVDNRKVCCGCWARYICGGGCLPAAIKVHGTPDHPIEAECDLIRHLIQLAIWVHLTMRERRFREVQDATRALAEG